MEYPYFVVRYQSEDSRSFVETTFFDQDVAFLAYTSLLKIDRKALYVVDKVGSHLLLMKDLAPLKRLDI